MKIIYNTNPLWAEIILNDIDIKDYEYVDIDDENY